MAYGLTFKLEHKDGTLADPPTFRIARYQRGAPLCIGWDLNGPNEDQRASQERADQPADLQPLAACKRRR
jgi:hypothetical protein